MLISFNKKTRKLIKKVSKKVAKELDVNKVTLTFGVNDSNGKMSFCFYSDENDSYADLKNCKKYLKKNSFESVLNSFLTNLSVEWVFGDVADFDRTLNSSCDCGGCK